MAESFFSMLTNERVYWTVDATKTQARTETIRYIEGILQQQMTPLGTRHSALGYRRPNEVHHGQGQPVTAAEKKPSIRCPKSSPQPSRILSTGRKGKKPGTVRSVVAPEELDV